MKKLFRNPVTVIIICFIEVLLLTPIYFKKGATVLDGAGTAAIQTFMLVFILVLFTVIKDEKNRIKRNTELIKDNLFGSDINSLSILKNKN